MKNKLIILFAIFAFNLTNQLAAQAIKVQKATLNLKEPVGLHCAIVPTENGCLFDFTVNQTTSTSRESGREIVAAKSKLKPLDNSFGLNLSDNTIQEVRSPRDVASGNATGRRVHSPIKIQAEIDKNTPVLSKNSSSTPSSNEEVAQNSASRSGKATMQDFHFIMKGQGIASTIKCPDGACIIPTNVPDGSYTLSCGWSWGMSQVANAVNSGKTGSARGSANFILEIQDGTCIAVKQKGS